jgi:hypothetical protein
MMGWPKKKGAGSCRYLRPKHKVNQIEPENPCGFAMEKYVKRKESSRLPICGSGTAPRHSGRDGRRNQDPGRLMSGVMISAHGSTPERGAVR